MMAALPLRLEDLTSKHLTPALHKGTSGQLDSGVPLSLGIAAIDEALPDAGLPTGVVVELCAPQGLGRTTQLALRACAAAQEEDGDWTAWVDPAGVAKGSVSSGSLFAPALVKAGVDLERLLVVRPPHEDVARVAVRLASSRLFRVIVVDRSGLPGATVDTRARWNTVVRRLALAAESSDTTILLLSSTLRAHRDLLPTAMRIELTRPHRDRLQLHVTKDRRGRLSVPVSVPVAPLDGRAA